MGILTIASVAVLVLIAPLPAVAQSSAQKPTIQQGTAPQTDPNSGAEMFTAYCAACHGRDAKGSGPAAAALKAPPADLTRLSANNKGTFPQATFDAAVLKGPTPSHGTSEMPVWGPVFRSLGGADTAALRVANLRKYVESLQVK